MNGRTLSQVRTVAQREFGTVLRTRLVVAFLLGYLGLVFGLAVLSATGTYLGLVLDLLTPLEALVPALGFAIGYRSILADRERGELDTLRTYPVSRSTYVAGVYLGRAVVVAGVVLVSLLGAAALVPLSGGKQISVIAAHATVDSPLLFLRYVVLTVGFGLVVLAVALLVSAAARSTRGGLALAAGAVLALVVGIDSALIAALTGGLVSAEGVTWLLAVSPNSAYRSLVFATTLEPIGASVPAGAGVAPSVLGLLLWGALALVGAAVLAWRT
ncbi:ABC transporter permease [Halobacteriales archaeon Cl-PHB]